MHRVLLVLVASAALATGLSASPQRTGLSRAVAETLFTSAERDFSVAFPQPPRVEGRAPESEDASGYRVYQSEVGKGVFQVRVDQYPAGIRIPPADLGVYRMILQAHAVESSSRLVSTNRVRLGGYLALEGLFATGAGARELRRVMMLGRRIYQVSYSQSDDDGALDTGAAFLTSFKIETSPTG